MISQVVAQNIDQRAPAFALGESLVSKQGTGNRCVTAIAFDSAAWHGMLEFFCWAVVVAKVKGSRMTEVDAIQVSPVHNFGHDGIFPLPCRVFFVMEGADG